MEVNEPADGDQLMSDAGGACLNKAATHTGTDCRSISFAPQGVLAAIRSVAPVAAGSPSASSNGCGYTPRGASSPQRSLTYRSTSSPTSWRVELSKRT